MRTLQRDWQVFDLLRVHKPQRLPIVLSTGEVRAVLQAVRHPVRRMALTSIYALVCGSTRHCPWRPRTSIVSG